MPAVDGIPAILVAAAIMAGAFAVVAVLWGLVRLLKEAGRRVLLLAITCVAGWLGLTVWLTAGH